jgi:hypothetical protein
MEQPSAIHIWGPGKAPPGHSPTADFWRVQVVTQNQRTEDWYVVLPLAEVLEALKTVTITEEAVTIAHPAFVKPAEGGLP